MAAGSPPPPEEILPRLGPIVRETVLIDGRTFLLDQGCVFGQGYLIGRPLPAPEIAPLGEVHRRRSRGRRASART